ncbi:unnamed protein product [Linum trigynum]|uniref:Uncharacterized protein n=1 Tax=Linum trigynum TaxID=586398 RepID=A0AAV2FIX2_9ROSI
MASPFQVNSNALFLCGTADAEGAIAVVNTVTDLHSAACPSDQWSIVAAAVTETSTFTLQSIAPWSSDLSALEALRARTALP